MNLIDSEIEKVEWILENRNLRACQRFNLIAYLNDRKSQGLTLRDICLSQNIKWFESPLHAAGWIKGKVENE